MDSLTSTFASALPPSTDLTPFAAKEGDVIAGQVFQEEVTGIFATLLRVAKIEVVQPGRLMRVLIPADSLFHVGEARYELLDSLAVALRPGDPESIVIRFYVRTVEETRLRFQLLEEQAQEGPAPGAPSVPAAGPR